MSVTFTYLASTWVFKAPQMGNAQNIAFQRINRHTRGGDLVLFRDDEWPKTETLVLPFSFVTEVEAVKMKEMVKITLGQTMRYLDHEGTLWEGYIQNPEAEVVQAGRNSWTITLNFEGDQV